MGIACFSAALQEVLSKAAKGHLLHSERAHIAMQEMPFYNALNHNWLHIRISSAWQQA